MQHLIGNPALTTRPWLERTVAVLIEVIIALRQLISFLEAPGFTVMPVATELEQSSQSYSPQHNLLPLSGLSAF